jgi:hypothetical protein
MRGTEAVGGGEAPDTEAGDLHAGDAFPRSAEGTRAVRPTREERASEWHDP